MAYTTYGVKYEIVCDDTSDIAATIEVVDAGVAKVEIKRATCRLDWPEPSEAIAKTLEQCEVVL